MNPHKLEASFNLRRFLIIASLVLLVCYGLFNARNLILGPSITIFEPLTAESETTQKTISIKGEAKNTVFLSLNERPISLDREGVFEEKLLLSPSFNIIEVKARDRFGKETRKTIKIYYKQAATTTEE